MRLNTVATILLPIILLSACASKDKGPPPLSPEQIERSHNRFLAQWDKDQDGLATCGDVTIIRKGAFSRADIDGSSTLEEIEFRRVVFEDKSYQLLLISDLDANADGSLTFEEFNNHPHYQFHHHDKNSDCVVDAMEAGEALRSTMRMERSRRGKKTRPQRRERTPLEELES